MAIKFDEAIENGLISQSLGAGIDNKCIYGNELQFNESLTKLECSDESCKCHLVERINNFLNEINLNISCNTIKEIVDTLGLITPYQIMQLDEIYDSDSKLYNIPDIDKLIDKVKYTKSKKYEVYEIFNFCGIKDISAVSKELFYGFKCVDDIYNELDRAQIAFISERLGINNNECMAISLRIYEELKGIQDEMIFAESLFDIYYNKALNIVFVDNVVPYINKMEYTEYLSSKFNIKCNFTTTIDENTDIVISNYSSRGKKIKLAESINDKYIANEINKGQLNLSDIGKDNELGLKPIGQTIFICTTDELIRKLEQLEGNGIE